jgi:ribosomal protein S18 acetylase RimI-like enzyme
MALGWQVDVDESGVAPRGNGMIMPVEASCADGDGAIEVVPIARRHLSGFHAAVDGVARERQYLAMLQAPTLARTRRFVLDSLKSGAVHVVALQGNEVLGWCDLRPKLAETLRHSAVLGMGVLAGHRGRGIGSRMLTTALALGRERGIQRTELVVRADNARAIDLYRRFDFVVEGSCRGYMRLDAVDYDALLMARLEPAAAR